MLAEGEVCCRRRVRCVSFGWGVGALGEMCVGLEVRGVGGAEGEVCVGLESIPIVHAHAVTCTSHSHTRRIRGKVRPPRMQHSLTHMHRTHARTHARTRTHTLTIHTHIPKPLVRCRCT